MQECRAARAWPSASRPSSRDRCRSEVSLLREPVALAPAPRQKEPLRARRSVYQYRTLKLTKPSVAALRSEEHTSELQSQSNLVCRLLLEKKNKTTNICLIIIVGTHKGGATLF